MARRVRFGAFEADLATGELFEAGRRVRLPHQSFAALSVLLERAGELVTREELRERVWPEGRVVEFEQGLNAIVNRLREALGDSAEQPRFVETLPRRGYRFIGGVEWVEPKSAVPARKVGVRVGVAVGVAVAVALVAGLLIFARSGEEGAVRRIVPFTSLVGQEVAPTFSPDGSQIAFAWSEGRRSPPQFDLYVKAIDSEMLRLTHHPANALSAAWSPDGTRIAFARQADDDSGIYVIPALGGAERRLAAAYFAAEPFMQIAWSPDGKSLAYATLSKGGVHEMRLLNLETLESRVLSTAPECFDSGAPAFSPDGAQLAFMCMPSMGVYEIHVTALPAGERRQIASVLGTPRGLTWAADGSELILANDAGEGGGLWSLTLEGKLSRLPFGEEAIGPGVAVRGARIAYVRGTQAIDIWRIDLAAPEPGTPGTRLVSSSRTQLLPQYSPDGTRIVFESTRSGSPEIWLADADGSNPTRLTSFNGPLTGAPVWCSDGRHIAFDSRASGISAVYVLDVAERMPRRVKTTRENLSLPAWSADCRWLFASNGKSALFRFPAAGGPAERVTEQPAYYSAVAGDRVIFNVTQADGVTLWSRPVNGGAEARLEGMPTLAYSDSWNVTRDGVYYFSRGDDDSATLSFYDFATQGTRRLVTLPRAPTPLGGLGISVSSDGRWLLYTLSGESQSDIMLVASGQ